MFDRLRRHVGRRAAKVQPSAGRCTCVASTTRGWNCVRTAAHAVCKPAEVFDLFSPYLTAGADEKKKKPTPRRRKREAISEMLIIAGRVGDCPAGRRIRTDGDEFDLARPAVA